MFQQQLLEDVTKRIGEKRETNSVWLIKGLHGNGTSHLLNLIVTNLKELNIDFEYFQSYDFKNSFELIKSRGRNLVFINDAHYFYQKATSEIERAYFIDSLKGLVTYGVSIVLTFSYKATQMKIPNDLLNFNVETVDIPNPGKKEMIAILQMINLEAELNATDKEIEIFTARQFQNVRHSINIFCAEMMQKSLTSGCHGSSISFPQ